MILFRKVIIHPAHRAIPISLLWPQGNVGAVFPVDGHLFFEHMRNYSIMQ